MQDIFKKIGIAIKLIIKTKIGHAQFFIILI